MRTIALHSLDDLLRHADAWNDLWNRSSSTFPLARAETLANHFAFFQHQDRFLALVVIDDDRWVAALPMRVARKYGMRLGLCPSNEWNYCHDFLLDPAAETNAVTPLILKALREQNIDGLWLDLVPFDQPHWQQLLISAGELGAIACAETQYEYGITSLCGQWETFANSQLSKNRRRSLKKNFRQLTERGQVNYWSHHYDGGNRDLEKSVRIAFGLEDAGWKGAANTSLMKQPGMSDFFLRQARLLDSQGFFELQFLELDGEPIAFELGCLAKGTYCSHKIGFDPRFRSLGPGQLLTQLLIERFFQAGDCQQMDSMGILNDAIATWTTSVHPRGRVILSSGTLRGRGLIRGYRLAKSIYTKIRAGKKRPNLDRTPVPPTPSSHPTLAESANS